MNAQFHHPSAQRARIYSEDPRGALTAFDSPVGFIKNTEDVIAFYFLECPG